MNWKKSAKGAALAAIREGAVQVLSARLGDNASDAHLDPSELALVAAEEAPAPQRAALVAAILDAYPQSRASLANDELLVLRAVTNAALHVALVERGLLAQAEALAFASLGQHEATDAERLAYVSRLQDVNAEGTVAPALFTAVASLRPLEVGALLHRGASVNVALVRAAAIRCTGRPSMDFPGHFDLLKGATPLDLCLVMKPSLLAAMERAARADDASAGVRRQQFEVAQRSLVAIERQLVAAGCTRGKRELAPQPAFRARVVAAVHALALLAGANEERLKREFEDFDASDQGALTAFTRAIGRARNVADFDAIAPRLQRSLVGRMVLGCAMETATPDEDALAAYYPKQTLRAVREGVVIACSDADVWVAWPDATTKKTQVCHAHPEGFDVVAKDFVPYLEAEVALMTNS